MLDRKNHFLFSYSKNYNLISEECDDDIFSQREMIFERCQFLEIQIDGTVRNNTIV